MKEKLIRGMLEPLNDRLDALSFYDDPDDEDEDQKNWDCDAYIKDEHGSAYKNAFVTAKLIRTDLYIGIRVADDDSVFYIRRYDMHDPSSIERMCNELSKLFDKADDRKPKGHGEWYLLCVEWGEQ